MATAASIFTTPASSLSVIDAKGDLIVGTGPDAGLRLPVGTDGQSLVADSTQPTGIKWAPPGGLPSRSISSAGSHAANAGSEVVHVTGSGTFNFTLNGDAKGAVVYLVQQGTAVVTLVGSGVSIDGVTALPTATDGTLRITYLNTGLVVSEQLWPAASVPVATTAAVGTVRLADAAAITAGTAGRVVDAAQLKAASATDTIQALTASGTVTAWGSLVTMTSATAATATLPAATAADVGRTITVKNLGVGTCTVAGTTITGQTVLAQNAAVTYECTAAGVIQVVSDIEASTTDTPLSRVAVRASALQTSPAVNAAVVFGTVQFSQGSNITWTTSSRVRLQPGTYRLTGALPFVNNMASFTRFQWFDVTAGAFIGSIQHVEAVNNTGANNGGGIAQALVSPTVASDYELRVLAQAGAPTSLNDTANGGSWAWAVVDELPAATRVNPGTVPVTPTQNAQVILATQTLPAAGAPITFASTSNGSMVAVATNTISLAAGKTYLMTASIPRINGTAGSAEFTYQFRDTTNNVDLGSPGVITQNTNLGAAGDAQALVTTTAAMTVQLWSKKNTNAGTNDPNSGTNSGTVIVTEVAAFSVTNTYNNTLLASLTAAQVISANGTDIVLNSQVSGNLPLNTGTGVVTLTAGATYNISANVQCKATTTGTVIISVVDSVSNLPINGQATISIPMAAVNLDSTGSITFPYTPTTNQGVKLRLISGPGTDTIGTATSLYIQQTGAPAVSQVLGATASVAGAAGFVPQPTVGQQDFALLGDGTFSGQDRLAAGATLSLGANGALTGGFDSVSAINVTATAANLAFTIPSPTVTTREIRGIVTNAGATNAFTVNGNHVQVGGIAEFIWNPALATPAWVLVSLSPRAPVVQRFTASGTYTPTPGMRYCVVEAVGGGGAGTGAVGGLGAQTSNFGGPGCSGGYIKAMLTAAQIGASQAVVIGAGGVGVNTGAAGATGGSTTLGGTLVVAIGGAGGTAGSTNANFTGGLISVAQSSRTVGTSTTTGTLIATSPPALGSVSQVGGNASFFGFVMGDGGDSVFGNGARAPAYTNTGIAGPGSVAGVSAGNNTGGGGTGALAYTSAATQTGGSGGSGLMVITEMF